MSGFNLDYMAAVDDASIREYLPIARDVARQAVRRYGWLPGESFDAFYSDALLGLYQGLATHDPERGPLVPHLWYRARMAVRDRLRTEQRQMKASDEDVADLLDVADPEDQMAAVDVAVSRPQERRRLEVIIDRALTSQEAWRVREHYFKGRPQAALAREEGVTPAAVAHSLRRAEERLARAWRGEPVEKPRRTPEVKEGLTPGDLEIIALLAEGRTNKEVARLLGRSTNTIGTRLRRAFQRTGTRSRRELTTYALRRGLVA